MIRAATPADAPAIAAILGNWVDAAPWLPRVHTPAQDQDHALDLVARGWTHVFCAPDVQGFLARDGAEIHALYVAKAARGQGVGKALLAHAKSATPALRLYTFAANTDAQRFYLREGFTEIARTDGAGNDEHLPDIRYEWRPS